MDADFIGLTLRAIRAELPAVPDDVWERLERNLRDQHGGRDHWIARRSKRNRLGALEEAIKADPDASSSEIAEKLGISVRHVQRLKALLHD